MLSGINTALSPVLMAIPVVLTCGISPCGLYPFNHVVPLSVSSSPPSELVDSTSYLFITPLDLNEDQQLCICSVSK